MEHAKEESTFLRHIACSACGSSDANALYDDGHTFCHKCEAYGHGDSAVPGKKRYAGLVEGGIHSALDKRRLTQASCAKWDYQVSPERGVQIANYRDAAGNVVAQKLRTANKRFSFVGDPKAALPLYGQWLWKAGGKRIIVTEGELDAISVSQVQDHKWPVVSVPNGASGAKRSFAAAIEYLSAFDEVVIMFDNDEPGRAAAQECALLLRPGKAKIATLPLKDASDMLQADRGADIMQAVWNAQSVRPDGLVLATDILDEACEVPKRGLAWPFPTLDDLLYGRREGELIFIGAGTGAGKTDFITEVIASTIGAQEQACATYFLEQPHKETVVRVAGKLNNELLHVPRPELTATYLRDKLNALHRAAPLHIYKHFGSADWDTIASRIRYLALAHDVKHHFVDHLTALAAGEQDERVALERITSEMASLAQELGVTLYVVSHLSTPDHGSDEEGAQVSLRRFKGSRSIGFWGHAALGIERNQQHPNEMARRVSTLRILKDRFTGQATGKTIQLYYDPATGSLTECPLWVLDEIARADEPEHVASSEDF